MAKRKLAQRKGAAKKAEQVEEQNPKVVEEEEVKHDEKEDTKSHEEAQKQQKQVNKVARKPRKRIKPDSEPEYFEDKRNLEDLWKEVFPVGTEWDQMHLVYQYNWNFTNLENAFEEGGVLHGKRVYLFGCTEPQMVPFKDEMKITQVPVVVAVVSPFPPSDKIGIKSVQRVAEEIVPMKRMKMDWVPYVPLENRDIMAERLHSEIFILRCTQRRSALRHLKEERVKTFEYCLPYFYQPLQEDELEQSTVVPILYEMDLKPVFCEFDWEFDEVEEFTEKLITEEELPSEEKDKFEEYVKEKVRDAKKANREARQARKKALEEMSEETKNAFENMRFYKFYPVASSDTPDVSGVKAHFINRYYGKAHEIF
ncbi:protein HEAT INTOLERANT 4 [Beta vulgaris subsp. vulgaris]|uniref:protein HEAT INTOLERANT 4 n=1 Tax=Beta vulgaris subsp. vulgaris TaxID=3555 RepID=UPI002036FABC|nr:protein HEAT INTOLERANT 4 [Beta vulgaris subsp. vulgaris]